MNKLKFISLGIICTFLIAFLSYKTTFALFSSNAHSTNNVFSAAQAFPTATPSATPTPSPTPTPQIAQTLVINEVLPVSSCVDGQKDTNWIEVYNGTGGDVNLKNFKLSDGSNITDLVTSNTTLPSHQIALIAKDGSIFNKGTDKGNKCWPDNNAITVNLGNNAPVNFASGILRLLASDGTTVIDRVEFGTAPLNPATNQSIERKPVGHDSITGDFFVASDFILQTSPTPGLGL